MSQDCPFCTSQGSDLVWKDRLCQVLLVDDPDYPGYCRVVLNKHVAEMTDLHAHERGHVMRVVFAVEREIRQHLSPDKINLASMGNQILHLHWHVIPRWLEDRHFPATVWGPARRNETSLPVSAIHVDNLRAALEQLAL